MTIRRGEPWGEPATVPAEGLETAPTDRAASRSIELRRQAGLPLVPIGLESGDLARTMGGGGQGRFDGTHMRGRVDLLVVTADGVEHCAVAHVVARHSWWWGEVALAMNAQFLGRYDVAPRSHPNDGKVDVLLVDSSMSFRERLRARRRARTGTHLPHPRIDVRHVAEWHHEFARPCSLYVDGVKVGAVRSLSVTAEPDALLVHA